ncbi:CARDB domain-containing protein [Nostoc parmelioides]|uniref:M10 family metallopeptidase C-terminal domain-containing protein n=1 Tax=Nostoc parmelioides FACHB-3921 TaxID=2692909 RepID=A0ABR8BBN5_9NOSO|nr:CARDB domain-containing protein [Nostoc parmelioides]MBD2251345.1 M10 family metallopeptidase C-terminal domain-containing protein [Nostoc parmelioides FACHB-3921]
MNDIDLIVSSVVTPLYVILGETIPVSWTVKNQGTVSALANYWYDSIYISNDQFLDDSDTFLFYKYGEQNTPLASGESYTVTENISIPNSVARGNISRYLLFVTDGYNNQDETDETNNVFAQAITINAPDLVVTAANVPSTAVLGETISVSWTVKNQGTVSAFIDWYDAVYISDDQFFDYSDILLVNRNTGEDTPLASGESYTATQDIYIPGDVYNGLRQQYLLFVADGGYFGDNQGETDETNNVFAQAITINAPDLVITAANAPTSAALNETISVSWTVKNQGTVSAFTDWYDAVYISDDQFFDYSDIQLANRYTGEDTPLASGESYTATQDIYIPGYVTTGDVYDGLRQRYLLFVTDEYNNQGETDETNNVFAQAITLAAPDLVITAANAPTTTVLNETISVSWTVKNQGTVSAFADWYDSIFISNDQFFDYSDILLAIRNTGEDTPLASGESYTATQDIYIPGYVATGDIYDGLRQRYLLFVADGGYFGNNQGETNDTNNVFAQAITINAPDLVITAANAPTSAALNETISVSWTVKNQSTVSAFADWYDAVYISDDQFFDSSDILLANRYTGEDTPLASGESYTATQDIYIPGYVATGDIYDGLRQRYLLFVTDEYNDQGETDETNNVFAQAITINAPDLVITAANAPTSAALNETISVSWTVKNQGTVSAFADWYDSIFISSDQFFDNSDTYITGYDAGENTPLASGGSYTATQDIYISNYVGTGDVYDGLRQRYLLFVTDGGNRQVETNKTNNVFAQAITINAPDLVITAANAPTTAALNETISVSWTVKNQGTVSAFADWSDYIYISDDQFLDYSDIQLASRYAGEDTPLASGESYTATQDIYIPGYVYDGLRQRYLLFVADGGYFGNNQGETNETNNVFAQAITINAPDLVITAANAPTTAALNETISVSWTVKNQGTVSAFTDWYDAVYISDDQLFDYSDIQLASRYTGEDTPLASGESYTATQDIYIPGYVATSDVYDGLRQRYLLFVADKEYFGNNQGETDETNNVFAQAITINAPDLVITAANAPTTAALGETISVSWTVKNQGTVSAFADWSDHVYISDDQFFDSSDTYLTERYTGEDTPLASGGSYTVTQDISINNFVATGDHYLLFVADKEYFSNYQGESDETNNVFAQAITIAAPDLVITAANAPTTAVLGETISVSWTVKNQGTVSAFADWPDTVYVSDDQFFDSSDTYLTGRYTGEYTPLASGESYTATQDIIYINNSVATGDRYLLFVADEYNNQGETNETNNVFAQAITINAPDLVITDTNDPTSAALGETISVSWTVKNQGIVSAFGDWSDRVYISNDQFFDFSDTYLTELYTGENTPLASGSSYTVTEDIYIPDYLSAGEHYLLFVADIYNSQGETNENNNVQAVAISLYGQDQIFNGTSGRDTLTGNDSNNLITGLQGADTLTGGAGSDRFVYTSIRDAGDTITDFVVGTDKIDLSRLFQSLSLESLDYESATSQGYLSFGIQQTNTTVLIDLDGTTGRARPTPLLTVNSVSQSTLAQSDNFVF